MPEPRLREPDDLRFAALSLRDRIRLPGDPVAAPEAQVRIGSARVSVLASRLLRLEWTPDGACDDRPTYAFPNRRAEVPAFEVRRDGAVTTVETEHLRLRHLADGTPFHAGNLSVDLIGEPAGHWTPGLVDRWNLGGARRTLDGRRGEARLESGLVSRSGWAVFDDGAGFRFAPDGGWVEPRPPADGRQDWYFFGYGHRYAEAVGEYVNRFGGTVPLPPRWMLGAWWSRYWAYRDRDLQALAEEFRAHGFPLDVLVIDMDWHTPDAWTGYTWNRELFPDPAGFLDWLHRHHLHATLNLHPALGVGRFESVYPEMARAMGLDPASDDPIPFRIADPRFTQAYFEVLHHPLEDLGVDFWWMDWQQGETSAMPGLDPLPWLNHLHHRDLLRHPERRPLLLSRWGGLGSHRYPIGFSGDTFATWPALRFQPRFTAAGANVAYGWWSHDIGGHFGVEEPELYVRWVQFGAFSPVLRLHSSNGPAYDRRPWAFGAEAEAAARDAFRARAELLPYLYTAARQASDTGLALVRPMSWMEPEEDSAYLARDQYLLGDDLLVAPVLEPADPGTGLALKDVWVPGGEWIERTTGETVHGPRWVTRLADLATVPQFVRAGTILPLAGPALSTSEQALDHLILSVFSGAHGAARVYHDDGSTRAYLQGECGWTAARVDTPEPGRCRVEVEPASQVRRLTLRLEHTNRPHQVLAGGLPVGRWTYDDESGRTTVEVGDVGGPVTVEVETGQGALSRRGPAWNDALRRADLQRLGDDRDSPSFTARAGGPLIHVAEHRAPDDARGTLGWVVVGAPASGAAADVSVAWALERGAEMQTVAATAALRDGEQAFECPFRWEGSPLPLRWTADVRVRWEGREVHRRHRSRVLQPGLPEWRVAAAGSEPNSPFEPEVIVADATGAAPSRRWRTVRQDPTDLDFGELGELFVVRFAGWSQPAGEADEVGWAVATFDVPSERPVAFGYFASGPVEVWCGTRLESDVGRAGPANPMDAFRQPRRTSPVTLPAGRHRVLFSCRRPADLHPGWWVLAAAVIDPTDGEVQVDVIPETTPPEPV